MAWYLHNSRRLLRGKTRIAALLLFSTFLCSTATATAKSTQQLLFVYATAKSVLDDPTHQKPFYLRADVKGRRQTGEAALYFEQPLDTIATTLSTLSNWCSILLLHLNTKACTHIEDEDEQTLTIYMGRKFYQEPDDAFVMNYRFNIERTQDYFSALITAKDGPLGTSDYRIHLEVTPINGKTFGRIQVSQKHSWISSKAAKLYVATKGRNKKGITIVDHDGQGNPIYSSGEQAIAERNLLRYYFAFKAFFHSQTFPTNSQFKESLNYWFDQTEQYKQLYEVDRPQYIDDKNKEYKNQVSLQRLTEEDHRTSSKNR